MYVMEKDSYMKSRYEILMKIYDEIVEKLKSKDYADLNDEELHNRLKELSGIEDTDENAKAVKKAIEEELERRKLIESLGTPEEPLQASLISEKEMVTVSFLNCGVGIDGYQDLVIPKGTTIHGPVIPPVPLGNDNRPKRITAQVFDCWIDKDTGAAVDLTKPITKNMTLSARYKFDKRRARAVGLGAAVGIAAFIADLAIATPIPVISIAGMVGLGIAAYVRGKRLKNLVQENEKDAEGITAFDAIPEGLPERIENAKNQGYVNTFLTSGAIACGISVAAHAIRGVLGKSVVSGGTQQTTQQTTQTAQVLKDYKAGGSVYRTAQDALTSSNKLNPYLPSYSGPKTYKAYFNGNWADVNVGDTTASILQKLGATDVNDVAIEVMNSNGGPLTWESLGRMI